MFDNILKAMLVGGNSNSLFYLLFWMKVALNSALTFLNSYLFFYFLEHAGRFEESPRLLFNYLSLSSMFISHYLFLARRPLPSDQELNVRQESITK